MKATIKEDIIIRVHNRGDTEIGTLPKGIGFERLRWDGTHVVDLNDLAEIWVIDHGQRFTFHCREIFRQIDKEVDGTPIMESISQLVPMTYAERKNLVNDSGVIRLKTQAEIDQELIEVQAEIVEQENTKAEFRTSVFATVTIDQAETYIRNQFNTSAFDIDSVNDVETAKRELRKMVVGFERMRDINILIARMLIAVRNAIKRLVLR